MYEPYLLDVFLRVLAHLAGPLGLGLQVWKLLLPISQGALVQPKHPGHLADGVIELEVLVEVECHKITCFCQSGNKTFANVRKRKYLCNTFKGNYNIN